MVDSHEKLRTIREVSDRLRVSEKTVRRWVHSSQLEAIVTSRKWLFEEREIKRFLDLRRRARERQGYSREKRTYTPRARKETS